MNYELLPTLKPKADLPSWIGVAAISSQFHLVARVFNCQSVSLRLHQTTFGEVSLNYLNLAY